MSKIKKFIFIVSCIFVFLLLIWQGIFWVGEYYEHKEYNSVMKKIDYEMSFCDWAQNYSLQKMFVVGSFIKYKKYRDYVAVQKSASKPYVSWDDWKKDIEKYKESAEDTLDLIKEELALEEVDIYSGNTSKEIWEMFLNALRDGDIELASKYFVLNKQAEHLLWFQKVKDAGMLEDMIKDLTVSELDIVFDGENMKDYAIKDSDNMRNGYVRTRKNLNNKWKLESI